MHPAVSVLLVGGCLATVGYTEGFSPASFHRTAFDKRQDEGLGNDEDVLQDSYPVQMPQCLARGGVCTSTRNCPPDHLLNLNALESAPCGDQSDVVCCKPTLVDQDEVLQVDACNQKGAFCTRSSSCPSEFRLNNPLLCGDQSEVSCCRTGLTKKKSVDFTSESKNELHVQNQKRVQNVDSAMRPIERGAMGVMKRKDISRIRKSPPFKLMSLGVAKRQQMSCEEVRGECVEIGNCPGDMVADQNFCSNKKEICCRSSLATVGVDSHKYVSFPDGGTDPEDLNPI